MLGYFLVAGIAFGLAYWITGTGSALWRAIAGAFLGLIIGWVGGTAILALVLYAGDFGHNSFLKTIGRSFGWALLGAGYGVYQARKKLKAANTSLGKAPLKSAIGKTTTNDAYAEALAEIDEKRIDKGTWARCYALSDGDESKAKALYIKARAEVLGSTTVWVHTQPAGLDGRQINASSKAGSDNQTSTEFFPKWLVQSAIGLAVFGVLLAIALPAYQDYSKRQAAPSKYSENDIPVRQGVKPAEPVAQVSSNDGSFAELQFLAEQGNAEGQWRLAWLYRNGEVVVQNHVEAFKWFRLAAEQGHSGAQSGLSWAYSRGLGVPIDLVRALMWISLAANSGNPFMVEERDRLAQSMTPQQITQAQQMARDCQQRNFKGCD